MFFLIVITFLISYILFNRDFFAPGMVYIESFMLAVLMAMIFNKPWDTSYSLVFLVYIIGTLVLFVFASALAKGINTKGIILSKLSGFMYRGDVSPIHISTVLYIILLLFAIGSLYIYFKEVYRISAYLGNTSGINGMFYVFHNKYILATDELEIKMSFTARITNSLMMALAFYFVYVFCNNVVRYSERIGKNIKYIIFPVLYIIELFIGSQRTGTIYIIFAFMFIGFTMIRQNKQWKKNNENTFKIVFYSLIIIVLLAFGLNWAGTFMGRTENQGVVAYFAGYLGGGIPNFSKFIDTHNINLWGEIENATDITTFRSYSGVRCNLCTWISNIATMGVIKFEIYVFIVAYVYADIYYKYIYKKKISIFGDYILILFAFAMRGILFVALTDIVMSHMIGIGYLLFCVFIFIIDSLCRRRNILK